ncbi:MAG: alpha/beta hydrolase-fold protein [Thermoanaerobaculia bacterium]|nr:alpha/beta hydrolase-fold protein [Thermoanaerobaculia bacterium]
MTRRKLLAAFVIVFATFATFAPSAANAGTPLVAGERLGLPSKVMGEERTLFVSVPDSYARTTRRYPVLYLTDAETQFEHTSATARFLARNFFMPEVIVVGVTNTDRTRDLSPSRDPKFPTSGGADRFLDFLEKELVPFVESGYRTAPYRIFAGHSAGGNFAFHAMRVRPDLFQAVIAVSPWLVWDDRKGLAPLTAFLSGGGVKTRALFFTSGDEGDAMRDVLGKVSAALKTTAPSGLRWESANYPGENHGSVVLPSHYAALRMIFDGWSLPVDPATERIVGTLGEVKKRYAGLSERLGYTVTAPELSVNRLGYQALAQKNLPAALSFFRYNAETYPESANVHDSLGDALEASGSLEDALASFSKAAELGGKSGDPNTGIFKANADRVRLRLAMQAVETPARR